MRPSSRRCRRRPQRPRRSTSSDVDVLMLRSDPSLDAQTMPWAADIGILFGREAAKRGVLGPERSRQPRPRDQQALFPVLPGGGARRDPDHPQRRRREGLRQGAWRQRHPQAAAGIGRVGRVQGRRQGQVQSQPDDRGDRARRLYHRPGLCAGGEEGRHPLLPDERPAAAGSATNMRRCAGSPPRTTSAATSMPAAAPRRSRSARPSLRSPRRSGRS